MFLDADASSRWLSQPEFAPSDCGNHVSCGNRPRSKDSPQKVMAMVGWKTLDETTNLPPILELFERCGAINCGLNLASTARKGPCLSRFRHRRSVGSLNVPIEHHLTIRYMVYNGYFFRWCPIYPKWDSYQPLQSVGWSTIIRKPEVNLLDIISLTQDDYGDDPLLGDVSSKRGDKLKMCDLKHFGYNFSASVNPIVILRFLRSTKDTKNMCFF